MHNEENVLVEKSISYLQVPPRGKVGQLQGMILLERRFGRQRKMLGSFKPHQNPIDVNITRYVITGHIRINGILHSFSVYLSKQLYAAPTHLTASILMST